jgi:hypothetical protein
MHHALEDNHCHGQHGVALRNDASDKNATAFTAIERGKYGLEGSLPPSVDSFTRADRLQRFTQPRLLAFPAQIISQKLSNGPRTSLAIRSYTPNHQTVGQR